MTFLSNLANIRSGLWSVVCGLFLFWNHVHQYLEHHHAPLWLFAALIFCAVMLPSPRHAIERWWINCRRREETGHADDTEHRSASTLAA
jgi:hypothetical protein